LDTPPRFRPVSSRQAQRLASTASVATTATAAAIGACRTADGLDSEAEHRGQLWTAVLTGNRQFGQRVRAIATPARGVLRAGG
jgi:hypothetical protein